MLACLEAAFFALIDPDPEVTRGVAGAVQSVDTEIAQHVLVAIRADPLFRRRNTTQNDERNNNEDE